MENGNKNKMGGIAYTAWASIFATLFVAFIIVFFPNIPSPDFTSPKEPEIILSMPRSDKLGLADEHFFDYAPIYLPTRRNYREKNSIEKKSSVKVGPFIPSFGSELIDKDFIPKNEKQINANAALVKAALYFPFTEAGRKNIFENEVSSIPSKIPPMVSWKIVDMNSGKVLKSGKIESEMPFNAVFRAEKSELYGANIPILETISPNIDASTAKESAYKILSFAPIGEFRIIFEP